jgi:cell wall-associated NlpC family hydrolase
MLRKKHFIFCVAIFSSFEAPLGIALDAVDVALSYKGRNYVLGSNGPILKYSEEEQNSGLDKFTTAFDCSGLTWFSLAINGHEIQTRAASQSTMSSGTYISAPEISQLQRGDLLFFDMKDPQTAVATHVGMYSGSNKFIHASSPSRGILEDDLTKWEWKARLIGARRLSSLSGVPSSKFDIGEEVKLNDGANVRHLRTVDWMLGSHSKGDKGKVTFGPVKDTYDGVSYWWWQVDFESGVDGWVAEQLLDRVGNQPGIPITDTVTVNSKEWAQPDLFTGLSWNGINAVCPAPSGVCNGTLKGYDVTGWTWASREEVQSLFNYFIGSDVLGPSTCCHQEVDSSWAPQFFSQFRTTVPEELQGETVGNYLWGYTSFLTTTSIQGWGASLLYDYPQGDWDSAEVYYFTSNPDFLDPTVGAWLYR